MLRPAARLAPRGWTPAALRAYVVTDDKYLKGPGLDLLPKIRAAAEGGATMIQLRLKKVPTAQYVDLARASRRILEEFGEQRPWLVIDDRLDVCLVADADGLHIGDKDLDPVDARRWLGAGRILGVSTYGEHARIDAAHAAGADYIGTGSIGSSTTKTSSVAKGVEPIAGIRAHVAGRMGIVSIGGVDDALARATCAAGCDGAAAVSYVLEGQTAEEVRQRTANLLRGAEEGVREREASGSSP